jgi:hypothetical protein
MGFRLDEIAAKVAEYLGAVGLTANITGTVNGTSGSLVPAFTVANTGEQLTVESTNQTTTLTPSAVDSAGGTFTITVDSVATAALDFDSTNAEINTAIELITAAETTTTGDLGDATMTIEFLDARAHVVTADGALLEGAGEPYTIESEVTTPAVAEHLAWAAAS